MGKKCLFTASTFSHINHFHRPYLSELKNLGWEVHIACGGKNLDIPEADCIFHIPFEKHIYSLKNIKAQNKLKKIITDNKYDLIITHTSLAAFFTRLACFGMSSRPRIINMVHGYLFTEHSNKLKRAIYIFAEKIVAGKTDLLLTMNEYDTQIAQKYKLGKKIIKVPGIGVNFKGFSENKDKLFRKDYNLSDKDIVLVYAAEFSKRKNQEFIINAMKDLPDNVKLILAGEGKLLKQCKELSKSLGLSDRIIFTGYINNIASLMAMSDIIVSSSLSEGLPFNIMEAMYLNIPIIASNIKGHKDLLPISSLYTPNCIKDFTDKVKNISDKKSKYIQYSNIQNYDIKEVMPLIISYYLSL